MRAKWWISCLVLQVLPVHTVALGEIIPQSKDRLEKQATHTVVGRVQRVYSATEEDGRYRTTNMVAEIVVDKVEKGSALKQGGLVYARYWHRVWIGSGERQEDASGHCSLPRKGDAVRVYLVNDRSDSVGLAPDGGFNVIVPNGFEAMKPSQTKTTPVKP